MAINLASKFASKTSDLVKAKAKTLKIVNDEWDFDGVNAIKVYTLTDPTVGNYSPVAASNRYGTPAEVQDTIQTWTFTRDRSFSSVMDALNEQDTAGVRQPAKYVAQAVKNVMVPEIDAYRLAALVTAGGAARSTTLLAAAATTAVNAYTNFLTLNAAITDGEGYEDGRVAIVTQGYYNFLKLASGFTLASDKAYSDLRSGTVGNVDGVDVVVCPSSRMPANTDLIITHPKVMAAPEKLKDVVIHKNAPGFNGHLIEYRHRYDAFVDTTKLNCLAFHKTA